jgi:ABC-type transport system involved in multi-copper enzyme maturation permease subunit
MKNLRYWFYLILHSKSFWVLMAGMLLFTGMFTVFLIVSENEFFRQMQSEGIFIKEVLMSLGDILLRLVPMAAVFLVAIVAMMTAGKYGNRTVLYGRIYNSSRAEWFLGEVLAVVILAVAAAILLVGVAAGSYFATGAVYGGSLPSEILTFEQAVQVIFYMLLAGLVSFWVGGDSAKCGGERGGRGFMGSGDGGVYTEYADDFWAGGDVCAV